MKSATILVVDDNEVVRSGLSTLLRQRGFAVTCASNVSEALHLISLNRFDVLLSDLHMPDAGDGLTVVSAMRHSNPEAVTLLLSSFPDMTGAANAILLQTDQILVKPMKIADLVDVIQHRLDKEPLVKRKIETLAAILQRTALESIDEWYVGVEHDEALMTVHLSREERCLHLPQLFRDLARRLLALEPLGTKDLQSDAASTHGRERCNQGYSASMMVEESRILQVTIFQTLKKNLGTMDFSVLLLGVMTIADEVESQLSQAMKSFTEEAVASTFPEVVLV